MGPHFPFQDFLIKMASGDHIFLILVKYFISQMEPVPAKSLKYKSLENFHICYVKPGDKASANYIILAGPVQIAQLCQLYSVENLLEHNT